MNLKVLISATGAILDSHGPLYVILPGLCWNGFFVNLLQLESRYVFKITQVRPSDANYLQISIRFSCLSASWVVSLLLRSSHHR